MIKLLLQPLLAACVLPLFVDLKSVPGQVALMMAALPTAANAFVLAKQFDIQVEQNTASVLLSTALFGGDGICFAGLAARNLTRGDVMLQEFKKFALRGNVVDLAIGVIIGAAFGKIVDSLVDDVIMPVIGRIFGGLDFSNYFVGLTAAASQAPTYDAAKKAGATLGYGQFITVSVNFIIIACVLFLVIKGMNRVIKKEETAAAAARAAHEGAGAADRDPRSPESARLR